jgi:hypothetical protein
VRVAFWSFCDLPHGSAPTGKGTQRVCRFGADFSVLILQAEHQLLHCARVCRGPALSEQPLALYAQQLCEQSSRHHAHVWVGAASSQLGP